MLESLPVIIWIVFVFFVVIATKNKKTKQKKAAEQKFQQRLKEFAEKDNRAVQTEKPAAPKGEGSGMISREIKRAAAMQKKSASLKSVKQTPRSLSSAGIRDDKNDWLSQQYAEEKRSERLMSAMFGLKMEHAQNCAAEKIREEHEANCDAEKVRKYSRK